MTSQSSLFSSFDEQPGGFDTRSSSSTFSFRDIGSNISSKFSDIKYKVSSKFSDIKYTVSSKFSDFSYNVKNDRKTQIILISVCAGVVALLVLILGLVFGIREANKHKVLYVPKYPTITSAIYYAENIGKYKRVKPINGIYNEGLCPNYPTYGKTLGSVIGTDEGHVKLRRNLIKESEYLQASGSNSPNLAPEKYTWMDKDGYLFQGTVSNPIKSQQTNGQLLSKFGSQRRLYKHTASVGNYLGDVSDKEQGIIRKIMLNPRRHSRCYSVTGLYAAPGEVIKVEFSKDDMEATGGITVHIGQALFNGQANNIWDSKNQMQRWPHLLTTLDINKKTATLNEKTNTYTSYIGSFIGGPIYIRHTKAIITVTISGAVPYPHFILGVTTPKMFEESLKSSAPFFDLEVWDLGVLHSGPRFYSDPFSYDEIYRAAILWDKVSIVTTYNNNQAVVFLYDPFVAAGAAVAFPGRSSVNCPSGWMSSSLNYNSVVSVGAWGNFHEYHHNFQGYGVGDGGEVTNNALNLVSYALFTKISSNRRIGSYATQGLDWWTSYTSSIYALNEVSKIKYSDQSPNNGNKGLALYACLLHNFGPDAFIKVKGAGGGQSYANYMDKWQKETHNNMYYYFNELLGGTGISNDANSKYSVFVPINCVYQTGRSFLYYNETTDKYEKKYFKSMRPFVIPYGETFDFDLSKYTMDNGQYKSGSILLPTNPDKSDRFEYKVKSVSKPENGKIKKKDDLHYQYIPDKKPKYTTSGEIKVTLEINDKKKQIKVDDVDLTLEFELSHETLKSTLQRTIYTYEPSKMYKDAVEAFNKNFGGYKKKEEVAHTNPTQNCNTDIWHYLNGESHDNHPDAPEHFYIHNNVIEVVDGKLYFADDSKYRIYLRGRYNAAVYYSLDGNQYDLGATKKTSSSSANFQTNNKTTYFDVEFFNGGSVTVNTYQSEEVLTKTYKIKADKNGDIRNFLYVKEVLIDEAVQTPSFIGLGFSEWTVATFILSTNYFDENNNVVDENDPKVKYSLTSYTNCTGAIVAYKKSFINSKNVEYYNGELKSIKEKDFNDLTKEEITPPRNNPSYANAYRYTYEFPDNKAYETDYFYTRKYGYSYTINQYYTTWDKGVSLLDTNFVADGEKYVIDNLFKEGFDNYIHTKAKTAEGTYFVIDMGKEITANIITFNGRTTNPADTANQGIPKIFSLYISNDNKNYDKVGDYDNNDGKGDNDERAVKVNIGKTISFRYFRIVVESSNSNNGHIILSRIKFSYILNLPSNDDNVKIINSDEVKCYGRWEMKPAFSTFGHVYVGKKKSKIKFEFTGTRLGILTSKRFKTKYQVKIDGKKVNSIDVNPFTKEFGISYISEKLSNKNHKVEVQCKGEANFDCFTYYTDPE